MSAREEILNFMHSKAYRPMTLKELMVEFDMDSSEYSAFRDLLEGMEKDGAIVKTRKERYGVPEKMNLVVGELQGNRRGFGFVIPDNPEQKDVYIGLESMNGAMHRDRVIARLHKAKADKPEGEIIRILKRANEQVVGRFEKTRHIGFVVPDDSRLYHDVFIPQRYHKKAGEGDKVVVKIEKWPETRRNPEGKIIKVLGSQDAPGVDVESLIHRLDLPRGFPGKVSKEASALPSQVTDEARSNRLDLRDELIFTIDGEDAKDFDDAISLEKMEGSWVKLGVHIADVSEYVGEGSYLDMEARDRGTSIYLVDRVIPMLPEQISNQICSLQPREDRLTVSLFIELDTEDGQVGNYSFHRSVISSKYRLTYNQVNSYLKGEEKPEDDRLLTTIMDMNELAKVLKKKRFQRGSIDFDFPEAYVELDEDGSTVAIHRRERDDAEMLIEEFMIKANEVVAEHFCRRDIPFLYRIHEAPNRDDIRELNEFLHNFGFHIKEKDGLVEPSALQVMLEKVKDRKEKKLINTVILRSLKQARYHWLNMGHFGLASNYYTHFTSPIRRYPDLTIHRILKESIDRSTLSASKQEQLEELLPDVARHSSDMERRAMEGERESVDMKMVEYMERKVGEEYDGHITSVMPFGFFVGLENLVEGLVHVSTLADDYYHYLEKEHALIGERRRKIYRLGDQVRVQVDKVNKTLREIDFILV